MIAFGLFPLLVLLLEEQPTQGFLLSSLQRMSAVSKQRRPMEFYLSNDDLDGFSGLYDSQQMEYGLDLAKEFQHEQEVRKTTAKVSKEPESKSRSSPSPAEPAQSSGFFQNTTSTASRFTLPSTRNRSLQRQARQKEPKSNADNLFLIMATSVALQAQQQQPWSYSSSSSPYPASTLFAITILLMMCVSMVTNGKDMNIIFGMDTVGSSDIWMMMTNLVALPTAMPH